MKLLPLQLPSSINMERIPLQLPFSPTDLLWRYPLSFPPPQQPPASPLMDFKTQLPTSLASDPRVWSRDDVASFLKWCEREFDLPNFDMEMFQMNGKALCFLTKTDLGERSPGAGDVLHNVLQMLVRDSNFLGRCLPSSPVTPTSRVAYPLSPHSHPPTPNWNVLGQPSADAAFAQASHAANLAHFMNQNNSVTLSPAPSVDSQTGSPQRADSGNATSYVQTVYGGSNSAGGSGSNQSDSDEESYHAAGSHGHGSPPSTPGYLLPPACPLPPTPRSPRPPRSPCERKELHPAALHQQHPQHPGDGKIYQNFKKEFFPNDMPEPNTNGRLLWDFLQQLLNDPTQRYTNYIAWKNHDTGVFKIVDPAGLAKLWGIQKNHLSMNYDKMSRALRYYYRVNILRKVQGERHCYQFLRNPTELKNIKNISLLRQQMSPTRVAAQPVQAAPLSLAIKTEPDMDVEEAKSQPADEEMPTDLSMPAGDSFLRKRPHLDPPKPLTLSDKHRISMIVGENLQKLSREREQHYAALNLSEKSEH